MLQGLISRCHIGGILHFGYTINNFISVFVRFLKANLTAYPDSPFHRIQQIYHFRSLMHTERMNSRRILLLFQNTFIEVFKTDNSGLIQTQ